MQRAIRKHLRDFLALLGLFVVALAVATYVLSAQRLTLPGWVPFIGKDFYVLKGEFTSAQAVTAGQGQTVNIAGVKVGEISAVEVRNGRAIITMKLDPQYERVYANATMLLRPRTGLQDMTVQLDPGTNGAKQLPDGATIPVSNTKPNVQVDEVLAALDLDSRRALQFIVNGAGYAFDDQEGEPASGLKQFEPISHDLAQITTALAKRRRNLARVVTNFRRFSGAVAAKDKQLAGLVSSSNAVFEAIASEDKSLREAVSLLPGSLCSAQVNLAKVGELATELGPTAAALRPTARELGPALEQTRPFFRQTTPVIRDELRPFVAAARPTVRALRDASVALAMVAPDLTTSLTLVNTLLNGLAYNPPGAKEEGFLFWLPWASRNASSVFAGEDAHGPIRRGLVIANCQGLETIETAGAVFNQAEPLVTLSNFPNPHEVGCDAAAAQANVEGDGGGSTAKGLDNRQPSGGGR